MRPDLALAELYKELCKKYGVGEEQYFGPEQLQNTYREVKGVYCKSRQLDQAYYASEVPMYLELWVWDIEQRALLMVRGGRGINGLPTHPTHHGQFFLEGGPKHDGGWSQKKGNRFRRAIYVALSPYSGHPIDMSSPPVMFLRQALDLLDTIGVESGEVW